MLEFYRELLDLQEPLFYHPVTAAWLDHNPDCALTGFPVLEVADDLGQFLKDLRTIGTAPMQAFVAKLDPGDMVQRVRLYLVGDADARASTDDLHAFVSRAFLEPFAVRVRSALAPSGIEGKDQPRCPVCDEPPLLAVLPMDSERPGAQQLQCPLCSQRWDFIRLTCTACGTASSDDLRHHTTDAWAHITLQTCRSCRTYLKVIDLRVEGHAVPEVDDIASTELDLWAAAQGWTRERRHVLL